MISNAYGSIFVGVILLALTGALLARLGGDRLFDRASDEPVV